MQQATFYKAVDLSTSQLVSPQYSDVSKTMSYGKNSSQEFLTSFKSEKSFNDMIKEASKNSKTEDFSRTKNNETVSEAKNVSENKEPVEKSSEAKNVSENKKDSASESIHEQKIDEKVETAAAENDLKPEIDENSKAAEAKNVKQLSKIKNVQDKAGSESKSVSKKESVQEKSDKKSNISSEKKNQMNFDSENIHSMISKQLLDEGKIAESDADFKISEKNNQIDEVKLAEISESYGVSYMPLTDNGMMKDEFTISDDEFESVNGIKGKKFALDKDSKITVHDLRTEENSEKEIVSDKKSDFVTTVKFENNQAQIQLDLNQNVQQNVLSLNNQSAGAQNSTFQAMLTNQIQNNASEIVKAGQVILKDNNVGSIKMILHPESLGNVKIDLQISDKVITGKIVCATQEAFNAFKESAESLKNAFNQSGFETSGFELSFAGQNSNGNQFNGQRQNDNYLQMARTYSGFTSGGDAEYFDEEEISTISLKSSVNIVA